MKGFIRRPSRAQRCTVRAVATLSVAAAAFASQGVAQAAVSHPTPTNHPGSYTSAPAGSITGHRIAH